MFEQIDATMHTAPEQALTLCKQVFVESYLWEPPIYTRTAERYGKIMDQLEKLTETRDSVFAAQEAAQGSCMPIYEAKILERLARSYYSSGDFKRAIQKGRDATSSLLQDAFRICWEHHLRVRRWKHGLVGSKRVDGRHVDRIRRVKLP